MNNHLRRVLRYVPVILILIPLQLVFLGLSKLCYMAANILLLEMTETVYFAVNGLGLGLGFFLYYLLLRLWRKLRPEGVFAALMGLVSLWLYFLYRNASTQGAAEAYKVFNRMYLYGLLWFAGFTALVLLIDFLRLRAKRKREASYTKLK